MSTAESFGSSSEFQDRRQQVIPNIAGNDRRQFGNSYDNLSEEARSLAQAIDSYKLEKGRRYINYEEMLEVICALGYRRS
jgi:hypothetical protein